MTFNKFKYLLSFFALASLTISCSEKCGYDQVIPCREFCELFEDFEKYELKTAGNWQTIASGVAIINDGISNVLNGMDASGASYIYNSVDFPENFLTAGCALSFDLSYVGGEFNADSTDNGIIIYQGPDIQNSTLAAVFVLNANSKVPSKSGFHTIEVPSELAIGNTLPSNSQGQWFLSGVTLPYSAADIANFNTLIQQNDGVGFFLDEGGNPIEQWFFDNFCFKQCCSDLGK